MQPDTEPEPEADAGMDQRPPVLRQEKPPTASEEEEWEVVETERAEGEEPEVAHTTLLVIRVLCLVLVLLLRVGLLAGQQQHRGDLTGSV